ncbi:FAD:protein FMN transferase [Clostridiaceae bacterium M8S5]|nr:FAD:protein FMN transferase [Clostridiaceae bacterium M8S5]
MKKFGIILIVSLLVFVGCDRQPIKPIAKKNLLLGTIVNIKIYDDVDDKIFNEIFTRLEDIENKMSVNIEDSEVSMINKQAGNSAIKVSDDTYYVVNQGKEFSKMSNGRFDISILPLVELWGIGTEKAKLPAKEQIQQKLALINYREIITNDSEKTIKLGKKNMALDLGGIAKGFAADEIIKILNKQKIKGAIIDLGGNVIVYGSSPNNKYWGIAVQNPFKNRNNYVGIISANNKSIVTSGIYERNFEYRGKVYHHILDTYTGYPVENNLASVTIVSDSSIQADALSTATFSMGLDKGREFINSIDNAEALFITKDSKIYITKGLKDNFELVDEGFVLIE